MGAWVDFTNHIHIAKETWENGILKEVGYKDITSEMIEEIARNNRITRMQIDKNLPENAYREIDRILERWPDLYFRIFGIGTYGNETFPFSWSKGKEAHREYQPDCKLKIFIFKRNKGGKL